MFGEALDLKIPFKYSFIIAFFSLANILAIIFLMPQFTASFNSDSESYIQTARYFLGTGQAAPQRLLKPLMPFFIAIGSYLFGLKSSFLFLNSLFYFFIGFLIFKIVKLLFQDNRQALIASILFLSAYPMLEYGITYMTDVAGWFFAALSVYLTLVFLKKPAYKWVALNALVSLAGFLTKEYIMLGILFFFICIFFIYKDSFVNKIKYFLVYCLLFLVPFFAWQAFVYFKFHYSYYDWYLFGLNAAKASDLKSQAIRVIGKSLFAVFLLGWPLVFVGLAKIKRMASESRSIIIALTLPSLSFFLWGGVSSRLYYIIGILLSILASWGIINIGYFARKKYAYILLLVVILAGNYFWFIYDDGLRPLIKALMKITY